MSLFGVMLVRIQSKRGKIRTRTTLNTDTFHVVIDAVLTHYHPVFSFYTPWKYQKTADFFIFSGRINGSTKKWKNILYRVTWLKHFVSGKIISWKIVIAIVESTKRFFMFFYWRVGPGLDKSRTNTRDVLEIIHFTNCCSWLFFNKDVHEHTFSVSSAHYMKQF